MSPVGRGLKDPNREIIQKQQGSVSNGARQAQEAPAWFHVSGP